MNNLAELSDAELTSRIENANKRVEEICEKLNKSNDPRSESFGYLNLDESNALRQEKNYWLDYIEELETDLEIKQPS